MMPFLKRFNVCNLRTLIFAAALILLITYWNQITSVYRMNVHSSSHYLAHRKDSIRITAQVAQEMSQKVKGETAPADKPKVESWIDRQSKRKQHLNDICRDNPSLRMNLTDVIHNKKEILWPYIVDDKYRILYGFISKVGTTPWKSAFLVLKGKFKSVDEIPGWRAHDPSLKKLSQYSPEEIEYRLRNYTTFMFVRDPLARVLSAYRDKFDGVIQAFRKTYGRAIIERYREKPSKSELETGNVTFAEFVRFITDKEAKNNIDGHWKPIYQMVLPCNIHYDYIGKLETWKEDTEQILKYLKIDHLIHFPVLKRNASHNDETFNSYYEKIDQNSLQKLNQLYNLDFQLFGYPVLADLKERKNIPLN